jgi:hypothetical protein
MNTFTTAKEVEAALQRELIENVGRYIKYLDEQSPIVSNSHYMLRDLYRRYGKDKVDREVDHQFAAMRQGDAIDAAEYAMTDR